MHHYMKQVGVYTKLITVVRIIVRSMFVSNAMQHGEVITCMYKLHSSGILQHFVKQVVCIMTKKVPVIYVHK